MENCLPFDYRHTEERVKSLIKSIGKLATRQGRNGDHESTNCLVLLKDFIFSQKNVHFETAREFHIFTIIITQKFDADSLIS